MGNPSKDEMAVAISQLRSFAANWRQQERPLRLIAGEALSLQLSGLQMGLFFPLNAPYLELISQISQRCSEGGTQMVDIADTLNDVATIYETEEANNVHRLRNLY
jgi:hypothetical protein